MQFLQSKSLLALLACAVLVTVGNSGCRTAEHAVDKTGRVLAHGERKLERHLPE
jgi:hypothetical protein